MILKDIASRYKLCLIGNSSHTITNISPLKVATSTDIAFSSDIKERNNIKKSKAGCIITTAELADCSPTNTLISEHPYLVIAKLSHELGALKKPTPYISPCATIDESVQIAKNTVIGERTVIGADVVIGQNCHIYPHTIIMNGTHIGDNCVISSGAVIGSQGFGNISTDNGWQNIYHLGNVRIGNDVHIGANTTIDRGTFSDTIIENGVRIDNLVHIAHNVHIGEHTAIAALCGIAGSTIIGKRCQIAGKVGIIGHLNIVDDVIIYATSTVNKSITQAGEYTSFMPIMTHSRWKKIALHILKFDKITKLLNIKIGKL